MNKIEEERKIIREMIEYAYDENVEHNANYEEIEKVREWVSRIVELEAQEMGYKTQVVFDEINEELFGEEDNGELFLCFSRSKQDDVMGSFIAYISEESLKIRALELYINENFCEYVLKNYKETPIDPFLAIMDTVFHELCHMRRELMSRTGVSSYISLINAKEKCIAGAYSKIYKKNHDSMRIEEDAETEAAKKWKELCSLNRWIPKRHYSFHKIGITKKQRDDFAFDMFDELMKEESNRYILKVYPVLQKEYNEDGTKKSLNQLLENMKLEIEEFLNTDSLSDFEKDILIKECKGMYFEILHREMKKKATFQDITCLAEDYNEEDKTALFSEMKLYFEERYKSEKQDIERTGYRISTEEQEKEIGLRQKYYQDKIDFLNFIVEQQQNENFLNGIINKGKKFVSIRKNKFFI